MSPKYARKRGGLESSEVFQGAILYLPDAQLCKANLADKKAQKWTDRSLQRLHGGRLAPLTGNDKLFGHPVLILSRSSKLGHTEDVDFVLITSCGHRGPAYSLPPSEILPQFAPIEDYIAIDPSPPVMCKFCTEPHAVLKYCNPEHAKRKSVNNYVCLGAIYRLKNWRRLLQWEPCGQALNVWSMEIVLDLARSRQLYTPHANQFQLSKHLKRTYQKPSTGLKLTARPCADKVDGRAACRGSHGRLQDVAQAARRHDVNNQQSLNTGKLTPQHQSALQRLLLMAAPGSRPGCGRYNSYAQALCCGTKRVPKQDASEAQRP